MFALKSLWIPACKKWNEDRQLKVNTSAPSPHLEMVTASFIVVCQHKFAVCLQNEESEMKDADDRLEIEVGVPLLKKNS